MDSQLRAFRVLGERLATRLRTRFAPSAPNASASSAPASAQDPRSVLTAGEVMTRDVITIRPDLPITQAMQLMLQRDISGLPVVDGGRYRDRK